MKHSLEIDSVILEFGEKRVLSDVFIKCETGRITGLLGRNGAGKTCLMKIAHGMLNPMNKSVRIDGKVLTGNQRPPSEMMYLPQHRFIPGHLNLKRIFSDFMLDFDSLALVFPELEKFYRSKIGGLSGGERRIVEIFVIIRSKTMFCLLDEPFTHITPVYLDRIKDIIISEKETKGILVTDHMYRHVTDISDDLYLIRDGATYLSSDPADLQRMGYLK